MSLNMGGWELNACHVLIEEQHCLGVNIGIAVPYHTQ
jgi:hypothetical protein